VDKFILGFVFAYNQGSGLLYLYAHFERKCVRNIKPIAVM